MKKYIQFVSMIILIFAFNIIGVNAFKTYNKEVYEVKNNESIKINFTWNTGFVNVTLISPSGKKIFANTNNASITNEKNKKIYTIKNAENGKWKARYVLRNNQKLNWKVEKIDGQGGNTQNTQNIINIEDFQIEEYPNEKGIMKVKAKVQSTESEYKYGVYAYEQNNSSQLIEVKKGTGQNDRDESFNIDISRLSTGEYTLMLLVKIEKDGIRYNDKQDSNSFTFNNENNTNIDEEFPLIGGKNEVVIEDLNVVYDKNKKNISVNWEDILPYDIEKVIVKAYVEDQKEPYEIKEIEIDMNETNIKPKEDVEVIKIEVVTMKKGHESKPNTKEVLINQDNIIQITYPEKFTTNKQKFTLPYKSIGGKAILNINNIETLINLDTEGNIELNLQEGVNDFSVQVQKDGVGYIESKQFTLDTEPPVLNLDKDLNRLETRSRTLTITGNTDAGATIKINDEKAKVDESGKFVHKLKLKKGENNIIINSIDKAGNVKNYEATVYKKSSFGFLLLILLIILGVLAYIKKDKVIEIKNQLLESEFLNKLVKNTNKTKQPKPVPKQKENKNIYNKNDYFYDDFDELLQDEEPIIEKVKEDKPRDNKKVDIKKYNFNDLFEEEPLEKESVEEKPIIEKYEEDNEIKIREIKILDDNYIEPIEKENKKENIIEEEPMIITKNEEEIQKKDKDLNSILDNILSFGKIDENKIDKYNDKTK